MLPRPRLMIPDRDEGSESEFAFVNLDRGIFAFFVLAASPALLRDLHAIRHADTVRNSSISTVWLVNIDLEEMVIC